MTLRSSMNLALIPLLSFTLNLGLQNSAEAQQHNRVRYSLTDLGPLPGGTFSQSAALTNNGIAIGTAYQGDGTEHATLWKDGVIEDLGTLGGPNATAWDSPLNHLRVVGQSQTSTLDPYGEDFCGYAAFGNPSSGTCRPFVIENKKMISLPVLGSKQNEPKLNGDANWINDWDLIVGVAESDVMDASCHDSSASKQVFQFKPAAWFLGRIYELRTFRDRHGVEDPDGVAFAVNDLGEVAGGSGVCTSFNINTNQTYLLSKHPLLWKGNRVIELGTLGGNKPPSPGNVAQALNNPGEVVGSSFLAGNKISHGFLWTKDTGMLDLGTVKGDATSAALGINDAGDIVGVSVNASHKARAFLHRHQAKLGDLTDLNTLIPSDSGFYLLQAASINARGQIVGLGIEESSGQAHSYVVTPHEESN